MVLCTGAYCSCFLLADCFTFDGWAVVGVDLWCFGRCRASEMGVALLVSSYGSLCL